MDAIRKQASKLREQVAKQQQAILRQLGQISNEPLMTDESEIECHQQLQKLYTSTKTAKHFQWHIVRGIEGITAVSSKQMEIVRKLAKECCKYGTENEGSSYPLARASLQFGTSYETLENEKETLIGILGDQISEPLRAQITGAPLEDAHHLTHRYDKLRQEVEAQAAEVLRRRSKMSDSSVSAENSVRLQTAETRLKELKSALTALGREATAAMLSVQEQQQQITLQSLCTMQYFYQFSGRSNTCRWCVLANFTGNSLVGYHGLCGVQINSTCKDDGSPTNNPSTSSEWKEKIFWPAAHQCISNRGCITFGGTYVLLGLFSLQEVW